MEVVYPVVGKIVVLVVGWLVLGLLLAVIVGVMNDCVVEPLDRKLRDRGKRPLEYEITLGPLFEWLEYLVLMHNSWLEIIGIWALVPIFFIPGLIVAVVWEFRRRLKYAQYVRTKRVA